jgi:hypothetical protein
MTSATPPTPLDRAQEALPRGVRRVPLQALLAGGGLASTALLALTLAFAHGDKPIAALEETIEEADASAVEARAATAPTTPSSAASSAPPPEKLGVSELDAAKLAGADALLALAQRFPTEPPVLQALANALVEKKDYPAALRTVGLLLELAPERKADRGLQQVVLDLANAPPDTAAAAFDLLRTRMDAHGPDLLFELVLGATGTYAKQHAALALAEPAVARLATPALLIAEELRRSRPCARKTFVARASAEGDARALPYLRPLIAAKGCGGNFVTQLLRSGGDCYNCFTPADRSAIASAIDAIDKREKRP